MVPKNCGIVGAESHKNTCLLWIFLRTCRVPPFPLWGIFFGIIFGEIGGYPPPQPPCIWKQSATHIVFDGLPSSGLFNNYLHPQKSTPHHHSCRPVIAKIRTSKIDPRRQMFDGVAWIIDPDWNLDICTDVYSLLSSDQLYHLYLKITFSSVSCYIQTRSEGKAAQCIGPNFGLQRLCYHVPLIWSGQPDLLTGRLGSSPILALLPIDTHLINSRHRDARVTKVTTGTTATMATS